jgi:hypothetical protein
MAVRAMLTRVGAGLSVEDRLGYDTMCSSARQLVHQVAILRCGAGCAHPAPGADSLWLSGSSSTLRNSLLFYTGRPGWRSCARVDHRFGSQCDITLVVRPPQRGRHDDARRQHRGVAVDGYAGDAPQTSVPATRRAHYSRCLVGQGCVVWGLMPRSRLSVTRRPAGSP